MVIFKKKCMSVPKNAFRNVPITYAYPVSSSKLHRVDTLKR